MLVWFGGLALIGGTVFWTSMWKIVSGKVEGNKDALLGTTVPVGMFIFGVALVWFGRYLSREDSRTLMNSLVKKLDAVTATHI